MSLIPTVYNSTDPGAPQLTGTVGSLTALLDAVLVDGYGVGADAKAPAGWTREFTASNVRVFRVNPVTGSGYRLRIDDSGVVGNARHAWARGFESMSSPDEGVNLVPAKAVSADGTLIPKSVTLGAVSRRWRIVANELFIYLFIDTAGTGIFYPWFAGDALSYKPGDMHGFVISEPGVSAWTGGTTTSPYLLMTAGSYASSASSATGGLHVARSHSGAVGSVLCAHFGQILRLTYGGSGGGVYPSPVNLGLLYESVMFLADAYSPRGELPGAVGALQVLDMSDGAILEGIEGFEGEKILVCRFSRRMDVASASGALGCLLIRMEKGWHH